MPAGATSALHSQGDACRFGFEGSTTPVDGPLWSGLPGGSRDRGPGNRGVREGPPGP